MERAEREARVFGTNHHDVDKARAAGALLYNNSTMCTTAQRYLRDTFSLWIHCFLVMSDTENWQPEN